MRRIIFLFFLSVSAIYSAHCAARTVAQRGGAPNSVATSPKVAPRAGTTQKVINTGTSVSAAVQNTTGSGEECVQKFAGCMDAFCMTDNINGGRCQCSTEHAKLASELADLNRKDRDSYKLATAGVEKAEMGKQPKQQPSPPRGSRVDLSLWNKKTERDDTDDQAQRTGAALLQWATDICLAKMPECKSSETFMRARYTAQIKSDCVAFSNAVKQKRTETTTRATEAKRAVRSAAYKHMQTANKYDLGQCTIEFKKCMTTTAGCGDDFKACVGTSVASKTDKTYDITNTNTKITIEASTYEILDAKRPMCDSVLNSCTNVRDQVWGAFLRAVGPELKTAELLAESDLRTSCMDKISKCFVGACKDNIDPKNPEGSYDMCLSRPQSVRSFCKNEIDPCVATDPLILDYVYARLAAMRVDSCTTEIKECLQSDERCGKDYTQCVGLDTDTIIRMCPYDKLVGCQKVFGDTDIRGDAVYDQLATMVQGLMLNIDNNMLQFCENAANEAMIKVCGSAENCNNIITNNLIGAKPLEYKICEYAIENNLANIDYGRCRSNADQITDEELGRVHGSLTGELGPVTPFVALLDGIMFYEFITVGDDGLLVGADEYMTNARASEIRKEKKEQITQEINELQTLINAAVASIESDPTVQFCMTGRRVPGMKDAPAQEARFPQLTKNIRTKITANALKAAKNNYYRKYDAANTQLLQDYVKIGERQAEIKGENLKDVRRELGRQACVNLADMAALPMSPQPPGGWGISAILTTLVIAAAVVVTVFTAGAGTIAMSAAAAAGSGTAGGTAAAGVAGAAAAAGLTGTAASVSAGVAGMASAIASGTGLAAGFSAGVAGAAAATASLATSAAIATGAAITGGALLGTAGIAAHVMPNGTNSATESMQLEMNGHHNLDQWNFKQIIDTEYDWDDLKCHKCVRTTNCLKESFPMFGDAKCKKWGKETEECSDTQF